MTQLHFTKEYAIAAAIKASSTGVFDEVSYKRLFRIFEKLKTHIALAVATDDILDNSFARLVKVITKAENNPQVQELSLLDSIKENYDLVEGDDLFKALDSYNKSLKAELADKIGDKNTKFTFYSIRNYVEAQQLDLQYVLKDVLKTVIEAQIFVSRNKFEDLTDEQIDTISSLIDEVKELDNKSKSNKPQQLNKDVWDKAKDTKKRGRPAKSKDNSKPLTEEQTEEAAKKLNEKFHGNK